MARRRKRNALPKITMRVPRLKEDEKGTIAVPTIRAKSQEEAKRHGLAWWVKGSLVEITIRNIPGHDPEHDPNVYMAICITSGTWPKLRVVDENNDQHPDFKDALVEGQYTVWGVL